MLDESKKWLRGHQKMRLPWDLWAIKYCEQNAG